MIILSELDEPTMAREGPREVSSVKLAEQKPQFIRAGSQAESGGEYRVPAKSAEMKLLNYARYKDEYDANSL